ncbi:GIY-YIG nuclease family protein [Nostoc sp.]|uniref:GIY-YIG nuclease family protein n=1 Tax=Nostoc sp. TaxID=1180 RepID=UPI002FF4E4DF
MAYMYILECADGSYYTGSTTDLERRLWQHQQGEGANHTAKRLPVKLVFCEYYQCVVDAFEREKQVQGWSRKKKQALISGNTNLLHKLAECQNETHYSRLAGFGGDGFDTRTLPSTSLREQSKEAVEGSRTEIKDSEEMLE